MPRRTLLLYRTRAPIQSAPKTRRTKAPRSGWKNPDKPTTPCEGPIKVHTVTAEPSVLCGDIRLKCLQTNPDRCSRYRESLYHFFVAARREKNCTVFRKKWLAKRNGINLGLNEWPEMTPLKTRKRPQMRVSMTRTHARPRQKGKPARRRLTQRLLHAKSRQRKYQLRHKCAGLCLACSRLAASGTLFCELHRRKRNLRNRERLRKLFRRKVRYLQAESYKFSG